MVLGKILEFRKDLLLYGRAIFDIGNLPINDYAVGDIILKSTPNKKHVYFYDMCYPKDEYYGKSMIEPLKVFNIFDTLYSVKMKGVKQFIDPYDNNYGDTLVSNNGILEYGNKSPCLGVDWDTLSSGDWVVSHMSDLDGDVYDTS